MTTRALHFRQPGGGYLPACGVPQQVATVSKPEGVTCKRCQNTHVYRRATYPAGRKR